MTLIDIIQSGAYISVKLHDEGECRADLEVVWACVGQDIANFDPRDEWVGTTIRFSLKPLDEGARTKLDFVHEGLAGLGCGEMCTKGWSHYIGTSLKGLVERNEGASGPGAGSA